ncbi:L-aspartate oxidase [Acidocella aquatica]|uniref:L-aspartate oxidase n=1 Tax=Acidocella aquatica TaxID=1922313 RepID=A0ABQ6A9G8_9PROT|nr:L-aspartate oxidase [Acidocella aquatica]GLR68869.1 L-aspartate oxidase [Acidocella aquatica]
MSAPHASPVIIGAGAAGLMAALCLAPRPVVLLCGGALGVETASGWAQGGIAAAVGPDDDFALHTQDTLSAGAGLCDAAVARRIIEAGPWVIEFLTRHGADFGRNADGTLALGLEAAHARRRIVHAKDATGAEVMRVLINAARAAKNITISEHTQAAGLAVHDNRLCAVNAATPAGPLTIPTDCAVIATGGVGGLFAHTTNPLHATGAGLALAARAGANLRDMEFVQFHPTALACGLDPMPLVSEAVRGEGAVFIDNAGARFMQGGDLAARDIVARAVAAKYAEDDSVFLDARTVSPEKFPGIFSTCRAQGIDPATQPIPVRPAAHYHMGGIAVNADCESSVAGLFACGEAAATGLHGANRLASNSLLEAMVTGRIAAQAISGRTIHTSKATPALLQIPEASPLVREICSQYLGIYRNARGLQSAIAQLRPLAAHSGPALVALLMALSALRRRESRGAHTRTDFPGTDAAQAISSTINLSDLTATGLAA